jgi:hypothetical protein
MSNNLTAKQEKVMIDLLNGSTIAGASKANKISETTIYNWLQDETFKTEYRKLRREAVENSLAQIQNVTNEAVETLRRNLTCENPSVEVRTAQIILDNAVKAVELTDLAERVEKLEQSIKISQGKEKQSEPNQPN